MTRNFVDTRSSVNIMYYDFWAQLEIESDLQPPMGSLFGFSGEMVVPVGTVHLPVMLGTPTRSKEDDRVRSIRFSQHIL